MLSHRIRGTTLLALIAVVALSGLLAQTAEAGCLIEHDQCAGCARDALWTAMKHFDLNGIRRANLQLWDCSIDLYHCILFDSHHKAPCVL